MSQRHKKQSATRSAKSEGMASKYAKLVGVAALCASAWLLCIYLMPIPEPSELTPDTTAANSDSVKPMESKASPAELIVLPKVSIYRGSVTEKSRLLSEVDTAVASFPHNGSMLHIAGLTYAELQQSERAIELLRKAMLAEPSKPEIATALADLLLQVGKPEDAIALLEQAIKQIGESESLLSALGESYSQAGNLPEAIQALERAVNRATPQLLPSTANLRLAQALTQVGRFEEAEKYARESVSQRPADLPSFVALSNALMRQNKREEAAEIRSRMPKVEPNTMADDQKYELSFRGFASHNYAMLGEAYALQNSLQMAEKNFIRSLEIDPVSTKTVTLYADLLRRTGRTPDAIAAYKRLIEIQPDNILYYHNLASLAVSVNDLPTAENALRAAATVDQSGGADMQLAQFLLGIGSRNQLVEHAKSAVEKLGTVDAYLVLMDACRASGDNAASFNAYLKAKKLAPDDPRLANFVP